MPAVQARFMNGDEESLEYCRTINHVRVQVATPRDIFAPDVIVLSIDQAVVLKYGDVPPPKVSVVIDEKPYDDARWLSALMAHAWAEDRRGVERAMAKLERDGHGRGQALCGKALNDVGRWSMVEECCSILIASRADVNIKVNRDEGTLLSHAAEHDNVELAQLLITARADLNIKNRSGETPLIVAVDMGCTKVAEMLINAGAHLNEEQAHDGRTALANAARSHNEEVARILIQAGANMNGADSYGQTPLILAVSMGASNVARVLVAGGADVNCHDNDEQTALSLARKDMFTDLVQLFINAGADK